MNMGGRLRYDIFRPRGKSIGGFAGHPPGWAENTQRSSVVAILDHLGGCKSGVPLNLPKIIQKSSKIPPKIYKPLLSIIFLSCHFDPFRCTDEDPCLRDMKQLDGHPIRQTSAKNQAAGGQIISEPLRIVANMSRNLWDIYGKNHETWKILWEQDMAVGIVSQLFSHCPCQVL